MPPSNVQTCHFFKLSTENYVKMWDHCDIMAIAVLNGQFARFMVGKFLISSCLGPRGKLMLRCQICIHAFLKMAEKRGRSTTLGGGRLERDPFGNSSACCPFLDPHCTAMIFHSATFWWVAHCHCHTTKYSMSCDLPLL